MDHGPSGSQPMATIYPMQPPSFASISSNLPGGPYVNTQRTEKFIIRPPGVLMEAKGKEELHHDGTVVREHEGVDGMESHHVSEFQNLLMCTESLGTEEQFHTNENASGAESSSSSKNPATLKINNKQQHGAPIRRVNKQPLMSNSSPSTSGRDKTTKKASSRIVSPDKRRQSRTRRSVEEPIIREVTVVDEQSVVPLSDVVGDLEFEDLEPEDLDLVRHLPPPGNVNIIDRCSGALRGLRDFERKLQDVLHRDTRLGGFADDADPDSDATLSIMSDDASGDAAIHSATNPATNMTMLAAYKMVFDPPVPAVVTIPTSIVRLNGVDDWKTEASALQYLMRKNADPKPRAGGDRLKKRKREEDGGGTELSSRRDVYLKNLIAAIEIKGNKVVHLNRPVFMLQHPLQVPAKASPEKPSVQTVTESSPLEVAGKSTSDLALRNSALVKKFKVDPLCASFLEDHESDLQFEELRKAFAKKSQLDKQWNQRLSPLDTGLQKDIAEIIQETQMHLKELVYGKERAALVVDEKYILDAEETEKRLQGATEKAKSHVINMFEENRRQYDLQRTLDYATCKYDMLAINTRNMRRRAEVPSRLLDQDLPSGSSANPNASPPHSSQSSMPMVGSQIRRRKNHFAGVLKDSLDDKEIYEDLHLINRELKDDPQRERTRLVTKSADVFPDLNRLTVDGKIFHRNQPVIVEHYETGKFPGTLLQFSQTEIVIKRTTDGRVERSRFPVGYLMDRRIVLKKRSISQKSNGNGSTR
ncbi:hypothetical protein BV898_02954 [Hypsibius exemplaris]|uniref:Sin3 histone deacetylase corepressor complex component SDS3 n=1 Tax=Hypsibius exemplaris TaxID=2072580 RepID=A0A1W0X7D9_HYPEX|nr:hypothetical protein BV898_02954 [Hypsibius exemplaris]